MANSANSWGEVARRDGERVFRAVRAHTPDDDAAWDCVQEAFLTAVSTRDAAALDSPAAWLCGVARNHARHAARSRRRFGRFLDRLARRTPRPSPGDSPATREMLQDALSRLSPRLREAVVLRHVGRLSVAEVARTQGISESAAKVRVHRGLKRLRRVLGAPALLALLAREAAAAPANGLAGLAGTVGTVSSGVALAAVGAVASAKVGLLVGGVAAIVAATLLGVCVLDGPERPEDVPGRAPEPAAGTPHADTDPGGQAGADTALESRVRTERGFRAIVREEDGRTRPAEGARFRVYAEPYGVMNGDPTRPPVATPVSDPHGRVEFATPVESTTLVVSLDRREPRFALPAGRTAVRIEPADLARGAEILLVRRGSARGIVLGPDGEPAVGARIRFAKTGPVPWTDLELGTVETRSDENGRFLLDGLPPGPGLVVYASRPPDRRAASIPFVVTEGGGVTGLEIRLRSGSAIVGRVVDGDSNPVEGVLVTVRARGTGKRVGSIRPALLTEGVRTATDGCYRLTELEPRAHTVFADRAGYLGTRTGGVLATPEGGQAPDLMIIRGVPFLAEVTEPDGAPVANASVTVFWEGGQAGGITGADGRVEIPVVRPGAVRVTAWSRAHLPGTSRDAEAPRNGRLRLVLAPGLRISGRIERTPGGPPILAVAWDGEGRKHVAWSDPKDDGRFVIEGLEPGRYGVSTTDDGAFPILEVEAGARDLVLRETPGGLLAGAVVGPDGAPLRGATVEIRSLLVTPMPGDGWSRLLRRTRRSAKTDEKGRFRAEGLLGRRFEVRARWGSHLPEVLDEVPAGSENLVLRLREGERIEGRVVAEDVLEGSLSVCATGADGTSRWGTLDGDGRFVVTGLLPGRYDVTIRCEDAHVTRRQVLAGTTDLRIPAPDPVETPLKSLRKRAPWPAADEWKKLWALIDERGLADEASLVAALPALGPDLRKAEIGPLPAIEILARIGTPAAVDAMVRMLDDPETTWPDDLRYIGPRFLEVDHPRIGPAAVRWHRRCVEANATSWVTMKPLMQLLAKHGGDEAVEILAATLRGDPGTHGDHWAGEALVHARDPRLLPPALAWLDGQLPGEQAIEVAAHLVEAFGEPAIEALSERAFDDARPARERCVAVGGLASRPTQAVLVRLLALRPDAKEGRLLVRAAGILAASEDVRLTAEQTTVLRNGTIAVLAHPDPSVRREAVTAIRYGRALHGAAVVEALRGRVRVEKDHSVRTEIERTLDRMK